jgi:cytoskeletal protein CcmA (bactofilin family)
MWFEKKSQPPIRTLVGEGTVITGELRFVEGVRVDGEVHGDVVGVEGGRSILVISEKGRVVGKVKADHVIINGEVNGPVEARELLELQPKARVVGDLRYEALEMHQGALIDGDLKPLKAIDRPQLKLAMAKEA